MPWNLGPDETSRLTDIVKGVTGFGTSDERKAIIQYALGLSQRARDAVSSLDLSGASDVVAQRVISYLDSFGQIESGEQSLELFLTRSVVPKVDLPVGQEIRDIINRCKTVPKQPPPQPGSTPPGDFDPHIEDVKKAIRTNLNKIKNCNVLNENENEVWILDLVSTELECDRPQPGGDLSEQITDFLTARCAKEDLMSLVRVFKRLLGQRKEEQAQRVAEIVDRMLPLCLPPHILSEAWRQLKDHQAVVIQNVVAKKAGAELVVAGLYHKPAKFRKCSPEPAGEQLVPFEKVPIGNPERNMEPALHDLFLATYHADATEEQGKAIKTGLTVKRMRDDLRGHYLAMRLKEKRPCYCAVELAATQEDGKNQLALLSELGIPDLLFVALAPDSKTREFESFVITCLNTRFESEERGKPA
jgi:Effector-associated domain 8